MIMSYLLLIYPNWLIKSWSLKQKIGSATSGISSSQIQFRAVVKSQEHLAGMRWVALYLEMVSDNIIVMSDLLKLDAIIHIYSCLDKSVIIRGSGIQEVMTN